MKKFLLLAALFVQAYIGAQTANVTYTASTAVISNPERGFYKYSATHSDSYNALNQNTLINYRQNQNVTVLFRYFYLEDFTSSPISQSYLNNMQADFDKIRNAGLKAVIRFSYSDDENASPRDASKTQILAHINQIKPILQANADVIMAMQAGFIGTWGEWYYTSQAEFGGYGYNGTSLTAANKANRKAVVDAILTALPSNRMVQLRTPIMKRDMYGNTALSATQAFNGTAAARIGLHNDCFLATEDDYGTYEQPSIDLPFLAQDSKYTPVGGETCAVNSPRSDCASALNEMAQYHWTWLNADYHPDVLSNFSDDGCMPDIQKKLGYRIEMKTGTFPTTAIAGAPLAFTFKLRNVGFASPFNQRTAYLVLKNTVTNQVYSVALLADPRLWLGTNDITVNEAVLLPANMAQGSYKLYLHLPDAAPALAPRAEYAIRFANEGMWESTTGYNSLNQTITVNSVLGVADNTKLDLSVYPVPTNDQLNVEMDGIADFDAKIYNALGQSVDVAHNVQGNKVTFETSDLSDGLYFVEFTQGSIRDVRKFIVQH